MSPEIDGQKENRRQRIRLELSGGLNSKCKKCPKGVPQHPDNMFLETDDTLNFPTPLCPRF